MKNYDTTIVLASVSPYMAERVNFILQGTMGYSYFKCLERVFPARSRYCILGLLHCNALKCVILAIMYVTLPVQVLDGQKKDRF